MVKFTTDHSLGAQCIVAVSFSPRTVHQAKRPFKKKQVITTTICDPLRPSALSPTPLHPHAEPRPRRRRQRLHRPARRRALAGAAGGRPRRRGRVHLPDGATRAPRRRRLRPAPRLPRRPADSATVDAHRRVSARRRHSPRRDAVLRVPPRPDAARAVNRDGPLRVLDALDALAAGTPRSRRGCAFVFYSTEPARRATRSSRRTARRGRAAAAGRLRQGQAGRRGRRPAARRQRRRAEGLHYGPPR